MDTSENTKHWVRDIGDSVDSSAQFLLLPWPLSFLPRKSLWKPPKSKDILVKLAKHTATWNWRGQQPAGYGSTIKYPPKRSNWDLSWSHHQRWLNHDEHEVNPRRYAYSFFTFTVSLEKNASFSLNQNLDPRHPNTAYPTLDNRMEAALLRLRKLQVASNLKKWGSKEEESFWMRRTKDFRSYGHCFIPRQKRGWIWAEFLSGCLSHADFGRPVMMRTTFPSGRKPFADPNPDQLGSSVFAPKISRWNPWESFRAGHSGRCGSARDGVGSLHGRSCEGPTFFEDFEGGLWI